MLKAPCWPPEPDSSLSTSASSLEALLEAITLLSLLTL